MKFALYVNVSKQNSDRVFEKIKSELEKQGHNWTFFDNMAEDTDMIIVIGGDGSILTVVDKAVEMDIPVVAFNTGRVGFLAELEADANLPEVISRLAANEYELEYRCLLEAKIDGKTHLALNEICVVRGEAFNVIKVYVEDRGEYVASFYGDGVLICTPTGSTAYSLSAGGPVLAPTLKALLLTPICAHSMYSRSTVLPECSILTVKASADKGASVVVDGERVADFKENIEFPVGLSKKSVKFVKLTKGGFYKKLHEKFAQWSK
ncbi:MAG: NAD(+)/NADH kinase [Clostridia bacterium]|nr:NAD(+)/NADH kinase [Clostridia bacterium]